MIIREHITFYGFFTKYSLLDNYGFINGLFSRILQKILPEAIAEKSIEHKIQLLKTENGKVPIDTFMSFVETDNPLLKKELSYSIISLSSKIAAFGLDKRIKEKFELLSLDVGLFPKLSNYCAQVQDLPQEEITTLIANIKTTLEKFRKEKINIGTSIHLTYKTRLVIKFLDRLSLLVRLSYNIKSELAWNLLIQDYNTEHRNHRSLFSYVKYHFDLLLLQIVEHTSYQGEKYVAANRTEHTRILLKSMKAGVVISIFACCKLFLDQMGMSAAKSAFVYGLNYALCFVVVKEIGGIIATKQPAMTASTIAKKIDRNNNKKIDNPQDAIGMIKDVFKSQSVSLLGNVIVVIPCSFILISALKQMNVTLIQNQKHINYLQSGLDPSEWTNLYYAAIAGVFLSMSGLFAGFVDNRIIFSQFNKRFIAIRPLNKVFSRSTLQIMADKISKNTGAHLGNIFLGLLLGGAFLIGKLTGFPFDIRHIAFSGSYLGGLISTETLSLYGFLFLFLGVSAIGLVNFISSFSLTLLITFKTRGITFQELLNISSKLAIDFVKNPTSYLYFKKEPTIT